MDFLSTLQILRLLNRVDEAIVDLNTAIDLCKGRGRTGEQAYTQRALIFMLQEDEERALDDFKVVCI